MLKYRPALVAGFKRNRPFFRLATRPIRSAKPTCTADLIPLTEPEADRRDPFLPTIVADLNCPVVDLTTVREAPVVFVINKLAHSHLSTSATKKVAKVESNPRAWAQIDHAGAYSQVGLA